MKKIIVKSQAEFDAAIKDIKDIKEFAYIYIQDCQVIVNGRIGNSCSVVAQENSSVVARENSSVEAQENSYVVARDNSSVVARDNSFVVARGDSSVEAWGDSSVEAWGNSSVEAWGTSSVTNHSTRTVLLFAFSVARVFNKIHKTIKKSKTATVIKVKPLGWFKNNGIEKKSKIILFKRVSTDFKTQENTLNETLWEIGSVVSHKNWNPKIEECGEGKFHACSKPYFCDEFRKDKKDDKYIAIEVKLKDTFEWQNPSYPHKIAFREGKVLYQCDKFGKKLEN